MNNNINLNPLIEKSRSVIPGTTFRLPSMGYFYENTNILHEDVVDGEVIVYPMRLREELAMKSSDSIFQGSAVTNTIRYCVPQILEPEKLASEDVDYLLTVIKKMTHGNQITYRDVCFDEERLKKIEDRKQKKYQDASEEMAKNELSDSIRNEEYEIKDDNVDDLEILFEKMRESEEQLNETQDREEIEIDNGICEFQIPIDHFINTSKPINPDNIEDSTTFTFENFNIICKPLTFEDVKEISMLKVTDESKMSTEEFVDFATKFSNENISRRIKKIDDIEDYNTIYEWVESLSLNQRTELYNKLSESLGWGIDFNYEITCPKCGISKMTDQSYINPLYFFLTS